MQISLIEEKIALVGGVIGSPVAKKATSKSQAVEIVSRFGPVHIYPEKSIAFPHGMPGIPGKMSFCLTEVPNVKTDQFKLLQCLENHALSFIVVPSTHDNQLLEPEDAVDACAVLGMDANNLLLLFIVTTHETPAGRRLSVNAKAPVFIDAVNRVAVQYVFQNNNYAIQHFIS